MANSYIASGFREDCNKLINQFEQLDSVRFRDFSEIWQKMKFSLIFTGRQSFAELLEFCEETLHISKLFLLPPHRFKARIGGLYLVYGVYYKMPVSNAKIRVTLVDWENILQLHNFIREGGHTDANFILTKLILDNAFWHVSFDYEFGLEKSHRPKERQIANYYSVLPAVKDMAEQGQLLSRIDKLSKAYHKTKCDLAGSCRPKRGLDLCNVQLGEKLIDDVQNVYKDRNACATSRFLRTGKSSTPMVRKDKNYKEARAKWFMNKSRPKLGHGFDTDSSGEETTIITPMENYDPNLPEVFDGSDCSTD